MQPNRSTTVDCGDPIGAIRGLLLPCLLALLAIVTFSTAARAQGGYCAGADLNGDGVIGVPDYSIFAGCFGDPASYPPESGMLGLSDASIEGSFNVSMNGACIDTFGPDARRCLTTEIAHLPPPVGLEEGASAWVSPVWISEIEAATGIRYNGTNVCTFSLPITRFSAGVRLGGQATCGSVHPVLCCRTPEAAQ